MYFIEKFFIVLNVVFLIIQLFLMGTLEIPIEDYFFAGDVGAGGRITFDNRGHVYFSIGMKCGGQGGGIQNLATPCGKIHRVNDDGSTPEDNPYFGVENVYESIYTYGHRSPQGLEYDHSNGELWGSEHGPRGGDEINRLLPAENYGWHSLFLPRLCAQYR
mgnify:CR=1 FL=1